MPAFVWREEPCVGVNDFLNADHRENNAVGFSSRSFVLVQFPVVGFFFFKATSDLICTVE